MVLNPPPSDSPCSPHGDRSTSEQPVESAPHEAEGLSSRSDGENLAANTSSSHESSEAIPETEAEPQPPPEGEASDSGRVEPKGRGKQGRTRRRGRFWGGLLGGREIENRVNQDFPSWEEVSRGKPTRSKQDKVEQQKLKLPPHRVHIQSPLHSNFLYVLVAAGALAVGYYNPELGPVLIYAVIGMAFLAGLLIVFRDGLFLHIEAARLRADSTMINKHARGPQKEDDDEPHGLLRGFGRKAHEKQIFRSKLFQIHYQNVLRTFEQGNRRAWVDQDASIGEIQTLLSQRGMKQVWMLIEVLPQLGLLGTLIGLMRMFLAFREAAGSPEVAILAGFATALGTTVIANIFVVILRPLYMRNERTINEILSTMQIVMAMFILPTQQFVLDRFRDRASSHLNTLSGYNLLSAGLENERSNLLMDRLLRQISAFIEAQQELDGGQMVRETAEVAKEMRNMLQVLQESTDIEQLQRQQQSFSELTLAVETLSGELGQLTRKGLPGGNSERLEKDMTQLRLLTHDTLMLLEEIAGRLAPHGGEAAVLLSANPRLRGSVFPEAVQPRLDDPAPVAPGGKGPGSPDAPSWPSHRSPAPPPAPALPSADARGPSGGTDGEKRPPSSGVAKEGK